MRQDSEFDYIKQKNHAQVNARHRNWKTKFKVGVIQKKTHRLLKNSVKYVFFFTSPIFYRLGRFVD